MPAARTKSLPGSRTRTRIVWGALCASMLGGMGLLSMLDPGAAPRSSGVSLSPLMAMAGSRSVEVVFDTEQPIETGRWDSIVLVHSGSAVGSSASIAEQHKSLGYNGLGFHFLVGNGTGMGEGEIHIGYRWLDQLTGADLAGLGSDADVTTRGMVEVCLIGDGDRRPFGEEQLLRAAQLVAALADELEIPDDRILLHKDLASTSSPGRYFPRAAFEELLSSMR